MRIYLTLALSVFALNLPTYGVIDPYCDLKASKWGSTKAVQKFVKQEGRRFKREDARYAKRGNKFTNRTHSSKGRNKKHTKGKTRFHT